MKKENSFADFEKFAQAALQDMRGKVKITGADLGRRGLPELYGDSYTHFFQEYHLKSQDLIDMLSQRILPRTTALQADHATDMAHKESQKLANKELPLNIRLQEIDPILKEGDSSVLSKRLFWAQVGIALICCAEGIFNIPIFQSCGLSSIESIFAGLIFGAVLGVGAHVVPWLISLGQTVWQRRAIMLLLFILTAGAFWYMGGMRAHYLENAANAEGANISLSSVPFTFASLLLMMIAIALPIMYYPSEEEMESIRKRRALRKEKKSLLKELKALEERTTAVDGQRNQVHISGAVSFENGHAWEKQIMSNAHQCFSMLKNATLMHRPDMQKPDCQHQAYPFNFKTFFQNNNSQNQQIQ